ncbi:hypothetical protein KFL_000570310 [Klebsormidium nitens]|uniref:Uncharacterized protein n=1 Tax=Klebsormidium nitens TaxID=105231 RepID=A0A0U9HL56_KLENI|nr:hypothetical protein KFL_000570310 [Klebsormidium nitens]|eukprot:GAQ80584.1 hypothetical protein KFL_000570310 [Klebsormidium nitens]
MRRKKRQVSLPRATLGQAELAEIARIPEVVTASWELLRAFDKNDARGESQPSLATEESRAALRDAVLVASRAAEINEQASPLLGICASSVADGVRALREWTAALNTTMSMPVSKEDGQADITKIDTPVYIKYNARSLFCYLTQYTGKYRGVIVQLGQQQVGHLPLSLFQDQ